MLTTKQKEDLRNLATSIAGELADTVHHDVAEAIDYYPYTAESDDDLYTAAFDYFKTQLIHHIKTI